MRTRKPAHPAPPPQTPIAARLKKVQESKEVPSLRGFWTTLCKDWPEDERVSYEAVRNYHYDRDPPVGYLARVAEVFDVSLTWLATGKGHQDRVHEAASKASEEAQPQVDDWSRWLSLLLKNQIEQALDLVGEEGEPADTIPSWVAPLGEVWVKLVAAAMVPDDAHTMRSMVEEEGGLQDWAARLVAKEDLVGMIARALAGPLEAMGVDAGHDSRNFVSDFPTRYILQMVPVLLTLADERSRQLRRGTQEWYDDSTADLELFTTIEEDTDG